MQPEVELTNDHIMAIGAITINANIMEMNAAEVLDILIQSDVSRALAYGLGFRPTVDTTLSVLSLLPAEMPIYGRIRTAMVEAQKLYDKRSAISHAIWGQTSQSKFDAIETFRHKRGGREVLDDWNLVDLFELAGALDEMGMRLASLADELDQMPRRVAPEPPQEPTTEPG